MKKVFKAIIGVVLAPIFLCLYFADRLTLVTLPWLESKTLMSWFRNISAIVESLIRVVFVVIVVGLLSLIF